MEDWKYEPAHDHGLPLIERLRSLRRESGLIESIGHMAWWAAIRTPGQELPKIKHSGRLTSFTVISNSLGGDFVFGSPLIHMTPSDARRQD